ncbi:MAG TPA: hypothetical protein VGA13_02930 [Acidimicrobiales bacterium]
MDLTPGDSRARLRQRQRRALDRYLRSEVAPFAPFWRSRLIKAGLSGQRLQRVEDLRRLPITELAELGDGREAVLRPTDSTLLHEGPMRMRWGAAIAKVTGRGSAVNRTLVEPAYKPIQWHVHGALLVGSTSEDIETLAELGRRWLELAGVRSTDVIVSLLANGPRLPFWQLVHGARRAGIAVVPLDPAVTPAAVTAVAPNVVVGSPEVLAAVLDADEAWTGIARPTTIIPVGVGQPISADDHDRLVDLAQGGEVVDALWVEGVRTVWSSCRGGSDLHTHATAELVEVVDDDGRPARGGASGSVVWTGIGWKGTALLRLRTSVHAVLDESKCRTCGRETPRLIPVEPAPMWIAVLDDHPEVEDWIAEPGPSTLSLSVALVDGRRRRRVLDELEELLAECDGVEVAVVPKRRMARMLSSTDRASEGQ